MRSQKTRLPGCSSQAAMLGMGADDCEYWRPRACVVLYRAGVDTSTPRSILCEGTEAVPQTPVGGRSPPPLTRSILYHLFAKTLRSQTWKNETLKPSTRKYLVHTHTQSVTAVGGGIFGVVSYMWSEQGSWNRATSWWTRSRFEQLM